MSKGKLSLLAISLALTAAAVMAMGLGAGIFYGPREAPTAERFGSVVSPPYRTRSLVQHPAERLLSQWSGYVERVYGTKPEAWERAMRPTLARLSEQDLRRAADMPSFDTMMDALSVRATGPTVGSDRALVARKASSLLEADPSQLAYNMTVPCRVVDTRNVNARLAAGGMLHLKSSGGNLSAQGGSPTGCGIPVDAGALVLNVTAVSPGSAGYLTVFPYGAPMPVASSVNYVAFSTAGNEIVAKQSLGQPASISVYSFATSDVVIDVVGYFTKGLPTRMVCANHVEIAGLPPGNYGSFPVYCPGTWDNPYRSTGVGGSCRWIQNGVDDEAPGQLSGYPSSGGYACSGENLTGVHREYEITAICCRMVPQGLD